MLEIIIIVCFAHRREIDHFRQAFLQLVGITVHSSKSGIASFDQVIAFVRRKTDIKRHQTFI
ncbi:MAG: hypothetical protein Udaeo2_27390 [Candidatus Udaeobacter sp.]|nr:MAG: hypothetical protein Udaeo2_27390 [Candidatus Udaeobacter sp.]